MAGLYLADSELERRVLTSPPVAAALDEVARAIEIEARDNARTRAFDTGQFAEGGIHTVYAPGLPERIIRASDERADGRLPVLLEEGTGIYGPTRQPIVAKNGGFLVFKVKGNRGFATAPTGRSTGWIRTRSVKGRPASHIMRDAGRAVAERFGLPWHASS